MRHANRRDEAVDTCSASSASPDTAIAIYLRASVNGLQSLAAALKLSENQWRLMYDRYPWRCR